MRRNRSATFRYAVYGAAFGLLFPVCSTLGDLLAQRLPITPGGLWQVQSSHPLHWVIDAIPILLAICASLAGQRQEKLSRLKHRLEEQAREREQTLQQLQIVQAEMEQQATKQAVHLRTVIDVGRATASILPLETLAHKAVDLIRERFDLYYAALFLVDATGHYAVLEAGTGSAGRAMKEKGHRVEIGSGSIVATVCALRQARIAPDAGNESERLDSWLLPDTRSEAALPLIAGDRVLGALDLHSARPDAFSEEDVPVMQLVADRLALAVDRGRRSSQGAPLLDYDRPPGESASRMRQTLDVETMLQTSADAIYQALDVDEIVIRLINDQAGWRRLLQPRPHHGFLRNKQGIFPVGDPLPLETQRSLQTEGTVVRSASPEGTTTLAKPIAVAGQVIGVVEAQRTGRSAGWTDADVVAMEALSRQLGIALEGARLYEDNQRRAVEEQLTSQIAARIRETLDVDTVLQTAVREMGAALGIPRIDIRLGSQAIRTGGGREQVTKGNGDAGSN